MNCYFCATSPAPGGLRLTVGHAVGVCQHCGRGVCLEHAARPQKRGEPLLCEPCAQLELEATLQKGQPDHVHLFSN